MPRFLTEPRTYNLFKALNIANPTLFIFFVRKRTSSSLRHRHLPLRLRRPSRDAPPSTKLASSVLLRHRTTHEKHPNCATVVPSVAPSVAPSRHLPPQAPLRDEHCHCSVPLLRRVCCASFTMSSHRRATNSPRGKLKTHSLYFFSFCIIFFDLGNCCALFSAIFTVSYLFYFLL